MALTVVVLQAEEDPTMAREEARITLAADVVRIGRGEGADVRLPDLSVNTSHLRIEARGGDSYALIDEGSENGTHVGEKRLQPGEEHLVAERVLVRVGRVWVELHPGSKAAPDPPGSTLRIAIQLVEKAFERAGSSRRGQPCLVVQSGTSRKTQWLLSNAKRGVPYIIGRGNEAHVQLDEPNASRRHVQFVVRNESDLWVRDLGSSNGTTLGQVRLDPNVDVTWSPGVALRVGASSVVYRHPWREALIELDRQATETVEALSEKGPPSPAASSLSAEPIARGENETAVDESADASHKPSPEVARRPDAPIAMAPGPAETSRVRASPSRYVAVAALTLIALVALAFVGLAVWLLVGS
jgi:pSer/pThr/pTyr-binding forkhead associated (FHA) protein